MTSGRRPHASAASQPKSVVPKRPRLLLIDDGVEYAEAIGARLQEVELVAAAGSNAPKRIATGPAALSYLAKHAQKIDAVLLDMHFDLPEEDLLPLGANESLRRRRRYQGVAILRQLRRRHPTLPVVLLTARQDLRLGELDVEVAAESMTYLLDGDDLDTLRIRIHEALAAQRWTPNASLLWGERASLTRLRHRLQVLSYGSMPVLLEGETGTGKSYLAEHLIHEQSQRKGSFVAVDLSAIPRELVAAHLFGARKGAFTGAVADRRGVLEHANGGTLLLDEVQNIPLDVQKQLLRVLQERKVRPLGANDEQEIDVKLVAASNEPLEKAVQRGTFRGDLYMRFGPASRVVLPPLRNHPEDIRPFLEAMVERSSRHPDHTPLLQEVLRAVRQSSDTPLRLRIGRRPSSSKELSLLLPSPAWHSLKTHPWPGNMRELASVAHNVVAFTLLGAATALRSGAPLERPALQVDTGLIEELLTASRQLGSTEERQGVRVQLRAATTLNGVSVDVERQYLSALFRQYAGDLSKMSEHLLGDPARARAVQLRMNQLGLRVRALREP